MNLKKFSLGLNKISMAPDICIDRTEWAAFLSHLYWNHAITGTPKITKKSLSNRQAEILLSQLPSEFIETSNSAPFKEKKDFDFRFIDLFAGIGGFRLALNQSHGRCVFSSEWDESARQTYFNNYGEIPFGDITKFTNNSISDKALNDLIPDHEVLAAGFPCQPFSRAGVSARNSLNQAHGFNCESQGTLFYDVVRIAAVKKPKALILENVRNLKSHDHGTTFRVIKETIEGLGYFFTDALINSQALVPQKRIRCYMIAIRNDYPKFNFNLTPFEGPPIALSTILETGKNTKEYIISEKLWNGHQSRTKRNLERGAGFTAVVADIKKPANTLVARYYKDGKECLIPSKGKTPRKLTKREAARLQGYPEKFLLPESKTPTYKQMGNSVSVPVVSEIASQVTKHLRINNGI